MNVLHRVRQREKRTKMKPKCLGPGSTEGTADLSGENTQLRLELNGLRKSLAAAEGEVSELRSHIDALQEEVTSLTDQLREKASSMVDVQDKLDQMTEENEILKVSIFFLDLAFLF